MNRSLKRKVKLGKPDNDCKVADPKADATQAPEELKAVQTGPVPVKQFSTLEEIQSLLKYTGPKVPISAMRVTNYKD